MFFKVIKVVSYLTVTATPIVIAYYLKERYKKLIDSLKVNNEDCEFIFAKYSINQDCRMHIYKRSACSEICSYNYLTIIVRFIETAKHSVSLCMCILTCIEIQDALIRAHDRGLQVRYISDAEMIGNKASRAEVFKEVGIPTKVQPNARNIMHHKFCLADENHPNEAKLFVGSLNLTSQALTTNWDFVIFTKDSKIIHRFKDEFEYLWSGFNYI